MPQQLLVTPASIFGTLIADMQQARKSIDVEYYIVENDRTGRAFVELLRRKSRQGLRVRLTVDGYGSRSMSRRMREALWRDGVELRSSMLVRHRRNHRKMAIIDDRVAHIGGVNIADRYVVGNKLGTWHDAQLRLVGEAVEPLVELYDYDVMLADEMVGVAPECVRGRELELYWSEGDSGKALAGLFSRVVARARNELIVTSPYFMPTGAMMEELEAAVRRGVRVMVVIPERCGVWLIDDVMRSHVAEAVARGIDVRLCRHAFVHAKMALVDRELMVVGSANLDARSMNINREVMALSKDEHVCRASSAFADRLLMLSTPPLARDMRGLLPGFVVRALKNIL